LSTIKVDDFGIEFQCQINGSWGFARSGGASHYDNGGFVHQFELF